MGSLNLLATLMALVLATASHAGVSIGISPASQQVVPGSEFEVTLQVTQSGTSFNAFDARVGFDAALLTAVPIAPMNSQIGSLFTGACSNFFQRFTAGSAEDTIACSMLCNGVSVAGPGAIYRLRFRAANTTGVTSLDFHSLRVFAAGLLVAPLASQGAVIGIGMPPTGAGEQPRGGALALSAAPNPARALTRFTLELSRRGHVVLDVVDVRGRLVRHLLDETRAAGRSSVEWNARDSAGRRVDPGTYFSILMSKDATVSRKVLIIR